MDLALLQMPMVLFTTLVPMASGAFVGLALAFLTSRFSKECLARIDRWTLLPMAILAVGYIWTGVRARCSPLWWARLRCCCRSASG